MEAPHEPIMVSLLSQLTAFTACSEHPAIILFLRLLLFIISISVLYLIYRDYNAFKSLGPGGTPSTPLGYLKIKVLGMFALGNVYKPASIPSHFRPQSGYLATLPERFGVRPRVTGIAPQRQQDQTSSPTIFNALSEALRELAQQPKNQLTEKTSCFEKHSAGLFALTPITRTCRGEVCHAHPSDGSLHMTLHPADAKLVLERGWGERHPLAKGGWFRRFVPREFVMIYAPRDEKEIEIVVEIVCAAAWWVSGINVGTITGLELKDQRLRDIDVDAEAQATCWGCRKRLCQREDVDQMVAKA